MLRVGSRRWYSCELSAFAPPLAMPEAPAASAAALPAPKWEDGMRIKYVAEGKKKGTLSYDRYEKYRHATTVAEALQLGSKKSDLNWDFGRGLVSLVGGAATKHAAAASKDQSAAKRQKTAHTPADAAQPLNAVSTPAAAKTLRDGVALGKGKGGPVLPVAGFGTYKLKKGEAKTPVLEALKAGYRLIDTAQVYENEADVGVAIRESGVPRENLFIETKVWRSSHGYERTMKAAKQSLKRLGTDYIDLYLIHWPGAKTGWPLAKGTICPPDWTPALRDTGTWRAMEDLVDQGKVKAIGVANYSVRHLKQLMKVCRIKPMVNQVEFHPRLVQSELLEFCKKNGIVLQAYASLGSSDAGQAATFFALPPVRAAAEAHKATPAQVLLRWALEKGALVVPKSCNPERIRENAKIFSFSLTKKEVAAIDAVHDGGRLA
eukprot:CAMPEP_0183396334 /NCGR_PEP_ID=MMETSP0370-20130417/9947_1 /TAXON_ID=268820 /ORGANISM="Peridinium aciculiferum, Strain PAER-2" /LENGTH=432 /DNA_ID=CAMNT_0025577107 /DNA_START=1 /DNA_END=1295 /DNA_ORIENTATION=+